MGLSEIKKGGASELVEASSEVVTAGQDWAGVAYVDPDAIGANPTAKIYPDGSIVGSTDNGSYTKYPNGDIHMSRVVTFNVAVTDFTYFPFPIDGSGTHINKVNTITFPANAVMRAALDSATNIYLLTSSLNSWGVVVKTAGTGIVGIEFSSTLTRI